MMKKTVPATMPDVYVAALSGWQRATVEQLRAAVGSSAALDEVIKWGHLVYLSNGPVLLIRAEETGVLFGFWRGQRLRETDPLLKPGVSMKWRRESFTRVMRSPSPCRAALPKRRCGLTRRLAIRPSFSRDAACTGRSQEDCMRKLNRIHKIKLQGLQPAVG